MALIVGLSGPAGSGKDTFALPAVKKFGFTRVGFSDPLKEAVSILFGWPREDLQRMDFKESVDPFWGITPRRVLQWFGTEVFRQFFPQTFPEISVGEGFWVALFKRRVEGLERVVVPDVRFENEADAILSMGGFLVWVERTGEGWGTSRAGHSSESFPFRGKAQWSFVNSSTLEEWEKKADRFWSTLLLGEENPTAFNS